MSSNWRIRGNKNKFIRKHREFSLDNFEDGYINKSGRFMVYYPNSERSYENGYIMRSIAAYELYHGTKVKKGYDIHHINGNKLDDSFENLIELTKKYHDSLHSKEKSKKSDILCICNYCKTEFTIKKFRLNEKGRGSYCSKICYQSSRKA